MGERKFNGIAVETSNEEKTFFPDVDVTKGDLIDYYEKIADVILPHLHSRPISMKRYPNGIDGKSFFQKNVSDYFPDWIDTAKVSKYGGTVEHVLVNKPATLVYLAQQACITPHAWLSRHPKLDYPDRLVIDLDPSKKDGFDDVRYAARKLHEMFEEIGITPFLMTTGSKGLHITVPLNEKADFDEVREFAKKLVEICEKRSPDRLTTATRKANRGDRLYLDIARNGYAQTAVPPYAVRARTGAPIATPLTWDELDKDDLHPKKYTVKNLFRRLSQKGDPWEKIDESKTSLISAAKELKKMSEN